MTKYGKIGSDDGHHTENNCGSTLAALILLILFIAIFMPNEVDLISDKNNTYVYIDGDKIPCEEYSKYRSYDYCNDEWKTPMG